MLEKPLKQQTNKRTNVKLVIYLDDDEKITTNFK